MRKSVRATCALASAAAVCVSIAPSFASAQTGERKRVQQAYTDFRSGLRHRDGEKACGRLTLRARGSILGIVTNADPTYQGGCTGLVDAYGRVIFNAIRSDTPARCSKITVRGRRATCTTTGKDTGRALLLKEDGRWKFDVPPEGIRHLWP